ncbi:MAG TPA: NUDIX domain-containing protein [Myxococcaceae bacterium]|nr:NUDIX domain-containing protein [Myxococcaceae bacterium]
MTREARRALVELLSQVVPVDDKEREDQARMLRFALELPEPLSRHQPTAHFTGSALVLSPDGERVCFVFHAKSQGWFQPGGHADPSDGDSILKTTLREVSEETSLSVDLHPSLPGPVHLDVHEFPAHSGEPAHQHLDVRFVMVAQNPDALRHDPAESHDARWFTFGEGLERAGDESVRSLMRKARRRTMQ